MNIYNIDDLVTYYSSVKDSIKIMPKDLYAKWCIENNRDDLLPTSQLGHTTYLKWYYDFYQKAYHIINKEKRNARAAAWYKTHKEQAKEYHKQYYQEHKSELAAYNKKWRDEHKWHRGMVKVGVGRPAANKVAVNRASYQKEYRREHKDKLAVLRKEYQRKHKVWTEWVKQTTSNTEKLMSAADMQGEVHNIIVMTYYNGQHTQRSILKLYYCSADELRKYPSGFVHITPGGEIRDNPELFNIMAYGLKRKDVVWIDGTKDAKVPYGFTDKYEPEPF